LFETINSSPLKQTQEFRERERVGLTLIASRRPSPLASYVLVELKTEVERERRGDSMELN
jgi:hypothetical protein